MDKVCDECKQEKIRDTLTRAMKALRRGHLKCAKNFLKMGTSVNTNDLITAAEQGDLVSVNKYVKAGVDVNHKNKYGFTPLIAASSRGRSKCVIALLEAGASVNLCPKSGKTALYHASWNGFNPCVEILMNAGADVNIRTNDNRTALFGAAMGGFTGTVKLLVEAGAVVNAVDGLQNSLLHVASPSRLQCVKLLLQLGVKINISNALKQNALKRFVVRCGSAKRDTGMLLLAAGETLDGPIVHCADSTGNRTQVPLPDYLKPATEVQLDLMHQCRERIRKQLIDIDPHVNLFLRIPKLGLPRPLSQYLLFYTSMD